MIKLVVCDFDGTLVGRDLSLPDTARNFAEQLSVKGVKFTVATGRSWTFIRPTVQYLNIKTPVITSNGAVIRSKGGYHKKVQFDFAPFAEIVNMSSCLDLSVSVTSEGVDYINQRTSWFLEEERNSGSVYPLLSEAENILKTEKISIVDPLLSVKLNVIERACPNTVDYAYIRYGNQGLDITAGKVNKAGAIAELAKFLGIRRDEILAIGDSENDAEMLAYAGIGAVVGNASETARKTADYTAKMNLFEGVQEIIAKFC